LDEESFKDAIVEVPLLWNTHKLYRYTNVSGSGRNNGTHRERNKERKEIGDVRKYVVCLKSSVNGTRKQTNGRYKQINFIGLQNNLHPSQRTVGNVHKASGNC
jgi:hypothetical protein